MVIGDPDNAVVFDFEPGIDAGAEILGRRGEDQRLRREAAGRPAPPRDRRGDGDRAEGETRADVARRLDRARDRPGDADRTRSSYEIGDDGRPATRRDDAGLSDRGLRSPPPAGSWSRSARRRSPPPTAASTRPGCGSSSTSSPPRRARGVEVVLVSSGAIAAGLAPLRLKRRPRALAAQQAAASVGQGLLVHRYTEELARHGVVAGQVLLTVDDVTRRSHYRNAYQTFAKLLELGVLPIVNENDTVATTEIRFGDNDRLAALVAHLVHADLLVLLSDVDGLYDADPAAPGSSAAARRPRRRPTSRPSARQDRRGRARHRRHADQGRGGPDRHRRRHPGGAHRRRPGRGRARRRAGRHPVPRHRPAPPDPAALARARDRAGRARCCSTPARSRAVTQRRASLLAAGITGVVGTFARRRPGRHRRPRRRRGGPRAGQLRRRRAARRCSAAPRTT